MDDIITTAQRRVTDLRILLAELRIRAHRRGPDAEVLTAAGDVVEWLLDDLTPASCKCDDAR